MLRIPNIPILPFENIFVNEDYIVKINGRECGVRRCRVSALPFNRGWPGKQRDINQSECASYITFSADEIVHIEVRCKKNFSQAVVRPLSRGVTVDKEENIVRFELNKQGQYALELDDEHGALHIFFNKVYECPNKEKATYSFGPGVHFPGMIILRDNDSVYIDEEAIVYASLYSDGAQNIHIYGGGVLDGGQVARVTGNFYGHHDRGLVRIDNSSNIIIENVILTDSPNWVLSLFNCHDVRVNDIKIIGHWKYNTDGIDIVNCQNVSLSQSFIRAFDDVVAIKGIRDFDGVIENITTEECVLWCGWGRTCEIGIETSAKAYKNIIFKNCDLIHNSAVAIDIQNGNCTNICDVCFENLNVEYQVSSLPEKYQFEDNTVYDSNGEIGMAYLIFSDNHTYYIQGEAWTGQSKNGYTHDVIYKNINVLLEEGLPYPKVLFASEEGNLPQKNILIEGLYINGVQITDMSELGAEIKNVENLVIR